ncbi:hypothetical protein HY229_08375 [Candidatus Acetothermia bacterium]|nr:hypothetical protein [Candidatus Acetothermia bacterium]MBI3644097.1 hypothetical protein [Candidatus Acetothermia bacterium]
MIGLCTALVLAALKLSLEENLWETTIIQSAQFLWWWYLLTGLFLSGIVILAWAGDLGVEGARLRAGIATPVSWLTGLSRIPVNHLGVVVFLCARRLILLLGAYFLMQGIQAVGALFTRDESYFVLGGVFLALGLGMGLFSSAIRRDPKRVPIEES